MPNCNMQIVALLRVVILNVIMLSVSMLSFARMLGTIVLIVVMLKEAMLIFITLVIVNLSAVGLNVVAPYTKLVLVLTLAMVSMSTAAGDEIFGIWFRHHNTLFFSATFKWAPKARALHYTALERIARDKHSSLLGLFKSCEENGEF
jgi:hypothetical protein